jgi:hypothetical protein
MPTNRKRVRRPSQAEPWIKEYMGKGYYTLPSGQPGRMKAFRGDFNEKDAWEEVKDELLPQWIKENPCTRPFGWWLCDSPESRRRVGGSGRRSDNAFFKFGLPDCWWIEVNHNQPPLYESEAAYLKRHGLLTPSEAKWLADHPEALEPVSVEYKIAVHPHVAPLYNAPPKWIK